jgi:hypothetical protein
LFVGGFIAIMQGSANAPPLAVCGKADLAKKLVIFAEKA